MKLGHVIKHLFGLNLSEVRYGHLNGHTWYGMQCIEDGCSHWSPTAHSMACPCAVPRASDPASQAEQTTVANLLFQSLPPAAKQALFDAINHDVAHEVTGPKSSESLVPRAGFEPAARGFSIPMSVQKDREKQRVSEALLQTCCKAVRS